MSLLNFHQYLYSNILIVLFLNGLSAVFPNLASACQVSLASAGSYAFPIVFNGQSEIFGFPISGIAAYAFNNEQWQSIPIQIDERNIRGEYVLSQGLPFTKGSDDGLIDANDEIVLDGSMLGDEFSEQQLKNFLPPNTTYWRLRFCLDSEWVGDVLLTDRVVSTAKQQSPLVKNMDVSIKSHKVETDVYTYKFNTANPALLGEVQIKKDNDFQAVIESANFRLPLKTSWFLPDMEFEPSDFTAEIESWQIGPLRTVIAVGVKYQAFLSLINLHLFSELLFYKNQFSIPTAIEFIFDPSTFLRPGSGIAYSVKFTDKFRSWNITSNLGTIHEHANFSNKASFTHSGRADTSAFYVHAEEEDVAISIGVRVAPKVLLHAQRPVLLKERDLSDQDFAKIWPWLKKLKGDLGIFLDFSGVSRGTYDFGLDLMLGSKADVSHARERSIKVNWLP